MNVLVILIIVLAAVALAAIAWALKAQMRAKEAELRVEMLREQTDLVTAQLTQSATGVAEAILRKNDEAAHSREQLAQARLEAQLKPVAESLQKFQEHVALVEKA